MFYNALENVSINVEPISQGSLQLHECLSCKRLTNLMSTCSSISEKMDVMKGLCKHGRIINKFS